MNARFEIARSDVLRIVIAMAMAIVVAVFNIECANATSVVACDPVSLSRVDKTRIDGLVKNLVAPQLLDESRNIYCKQGTITIASFQTIPVLAADGALETRFATCHWARRWKCELSRERTIDLVEATSSATVRITTQDELSIDQLRALYAAALEWAGNGSTSEGLACHTRADDAQRFRALFIQSPSKTIKVSQKGELFSVERDHIEIKLSIEEDAKGVRTTQYRCITHWPSGDRANSSVPPIDQR